MADVLSIIADTIEPRIARDRLVALADGRHWDVTKSTAFVDGLTRTGMLWPLPKTPEWATTTTGLYSRLHKTDYTFTTSPYILPGTAPPYPAGTPTDQSKWVEFAHDYAGNIYMVGQGVNDRAVTNQKWQKNRAFHLSWFSYNSGNTAQIQMECGWLSDDGYLGLLLWTDGKCEIYKSGVFVGEGNIYERHVTTQTIYGSERDSFNTRPKSARGDTKQLAQQTVDLLIIPCRRRDLLLLSNQGGGFRFTFEDLDPENPDNAITPGNANFFWQVRKGQVKVQLAPCNFKTDGYLVTDVNALTQAPAITDTDPTFTAYFDHPGYGGDTDCEVSLVEPDSLAAFSPDGTKKQVRIKAALSGDGTSSPWAYGGSAVYDPIIQDTDGSGAVDITEFAQSCDLSVPESPTDVTMKVQLRAPQALADAGFVQANVVSNRPVQCYIGTVAFLTGRMDPTGSNVGWDDLSSTLMQSYRDFCLAMEECRIDTPVPVDGLELAEALKHFARLPGFDDTLFDIPDLGFALPTIAGTSEGEFALLPKEGDKALDWFKKLWEMYAQHTEWGWVPTADGPRLQMQSLDDLDAAAPILTVYPRMEDARDFGGYSPSEAVNFVYRTLEPQTIKCEANDIIIKGRDPRTGKAFQVRYPDRRSLDPTLPPDQRPANWVGEPRVYKYVNPAIPNNAAATRSAITIARRVTPAREIQPFECSMLIRPDGAPVWRTQKVTLFGVGDVRIKTFATKFELEDTSKVWRPTHYTGELVA